MKHFIALALLFFTFSVDAFWNASAPRTCIPKRYQLRSDISCVCNATYCDDFPPIGRLNSGEAVIYVSSMTGDRFLRIRKNFKNNDLNEEINNEVVDIEAIVNFAQHYQSIVGFGGAFTDSAGINLNRLSENTRKNLLRSYFADNGIEYTIGRVPIASCDFSTHVYSYCDTPDDFSLSTFNLTDEDYKLKFHESGHKIWTRLDPIQQNELIGSNLNLAQNTRPYTREIRIPFIKEALAYANLSLFASPWSAPGWMKESGKMVGGTSLKPPFNGKYYLTWTNYFLRFFEEYAKVGINYWGVTLQNEPASGALKGYPFQAMYFTPIMQRDFISTILGPQLRSHELTKHLKIMAHDDSTYLLPLHADVMLQDENATKYIDGIAFHWYSDFLTSPKRLASVHKSHPDKFILATEACSGYVPFFLGPVFGDWYRGEEYAYRIINDLENWVVGWTDWNLCLDEQGGPNFVSNFVDSPIIVNNTIDEFYKQPMYYALGHFSKFIRPGSIRIGLKLKLIGLSDDPERLTATAFLTPENNVVLVLLNRHATNRYAIQVRSAETNPGVETLKIIMEPNSIVTAVWKKPDRRYKKKKHAKELYY